MCIALEKNNKQWSSDGKNFDLLLGLMAVASRGGSSDFRGAVFPDGFSFESAVQSGVKLERCDFTGAEFLGEVTSGGPGFVFKDCDFSRSRFHGDVNFTNNVFHGSTSFFKSRFFKGAYFVGANFAQSADFRNSKFVGEVADFDRASLSGARFDHAHFDAGAKFLSTNFHQTATFDGATFGNEQTTSLDVVADFAGAIFHGSVSAVKARFAGGVKLETTTVMGRSTFRGSRFLVAPSITEGFRGSAGFEDCTFTRGDEVAFRQLKLLMENQGHYWEATVFYGYELAEQRKHQSPWQNIRTLNWAFWAISDYNRKWWRPIGILVALWVAFGIAYLTLGWFEFADEKHLAGWQADLHDSSRIIQALFFSAQNLRIPWLFGRSVLIASSKWALATTVVQSLIDVGLLAMAIIAARRRFRIA